MTPWHSPQTPTAPQRQTTRGKTLLFCDASRTKELDFPQPQNGPRSPKNLEKRAPWLIIFFDDRAADGRKHTANMRELEISKNVHFCNVHFSRNKKHILCKTVCILGPSTGCFKCFFAHPNFDVLRPKKREAQTKKRARNLAPASKFRSPGPPKGGHSGGKGGQKGEAFSVLRDESGRGPAGHPVIVQL